MGHHLVWILHFLHPGMSKDLGGQGCKSWRGALQPRLPHQRGRHMSGDPCGYMFFVGTENMGGLKMFYVWFYDSWCFNTCGTCQRHPRSDDEVIGLHGFAWVSKVRTTWNSHSKTSSGASSFISFIHKRKKKLLRPIDVPNSHWLVD